jgi:hypothetical protein
MRAPIKAVGCLVVVAGTLGLVSCAKPPATQSAAAAFRRNFVDSYARTAVKHGRDPQEATAEGNCLVDALSAKLTVVDWTELAAAGSVGSQIPKRLEPMVVEAASGCLPAAAPNRAAASASSAPSAAAVQWDTEDGARVAHQVRRLRVEEERRQRQVAGHLVSMPTGTCVAEAVVEDHGVVTPQPSVHCTDGRIASFMREAILASQPLQAAAGSTVRLAVTMNDPTPVDAPE